MYDYVNECIGLNNYLNLCLLEFVIVIERMLLGQDGIILVVFNIMIGVFVRREDRDREIYREKVKDC